MLLGHCCWCGRGLNELTLEGCYCDHHIFGSRNQMRKTLSPTRMSFCLFQLHNVRLITSVLVPVNITAASTDASQLLVSRHWCQELSHFICSRLIRHWSATCSDSTSCWVSVKHTVECSKRDVTVWRPSVFLSRLFLTLIGRAAHSRMEQHATRPAYISVRVLRGRDILCYMYIIYRINSLRFARR